MKNLSGKVAAITGAGSGIGRALALNLAKANCHLAISDINQEGLDETSKMLALYPVQVTSRTLDVTDQKEVFSWADEVVNEFGKVNLIFNNAGVAMSGTVQKSNLDDIRWAMDINFWGTVYGTKAFLPHLEQSGEGHIINISSVFGLTAQPLMSAYNASKFAVRGFTESLRQDLALTHSCVSATCVHPGGIKTNIAKTARISDSVKEVTGLSSTASIREFERLFINSPDSAAKTILAAVLKDKRRVLIGPDAHAFDLLARVAPAKYQWLFTKAMSVRKGNNNLPLS